MTAVGNRDYMLRMGLLLMIDPRYYGRGTWRVIASIQPFCTSYAVTFPWILKATSCLLAHVHWRMSHLISNRTKVFILT